MNVEPTHRNADRQRELAKLLNETGGIRLTPRARRALKKRKVSESAMRRILRELFDGLTVEIDGNGVICVEGT